MNRLYNTVRQTGFEAGMWIGQELVAPALHRVLRAAARAAGRVTRNAGDVLP